MDDDERGTGGDGVGGRFVDLKGKANGGGKGSGCKGTRDELEE